MRPHRLRLVVLPLVLSLGVLPTGLADTAPPTLSQAELSAGGTKQARARFKALPPDAKIRLEDGRILTKAQIMGGSMKKPRPDLSGKASESAVSAHLVERNAALQGRVKAKLSAAAARVFGELKHMAPPPAPCPKPKIESIFPFSNFTPGGSVLVKGCGFGAAQGQFVLSLSSGHDVPLTNIQWTPNGVAGTLPGLDHPVLKNAKTQPATLMVTHPKGSDKSGPVLYRAARVVNRYPFDLVHTTVSTGSDEDRCYVWGQGPTGICTHYTQPLWIGSGDEGIDTFAVNLKNGWTLDSWEFTPLGGLCCIKPKWTSHKGQGQSLATEQIEWFTPCADCTAAYYIDVFVEGEIGTTWK